MLPQQSESDAEDNSPTVCGTCKRARSGLGLRQLFRDLFPSRNARKQLPHLVFLRLNTGIYSFLPPFESIAGYLYYTESCPPVSCVICPMFCQTKTSPPPSCGRDVLYNDTMRKINWYALLLLLAVFATIGANELGYGAIALLPGLLLSVWLLYKIAPPKN